MEPVIALIYDCDDTLCRDTTDLLLGTHGIDVEKFWSYVSRRVEKGPGFAPCLLNKNSRGG
ncbi:MAG: hypothetical protein ACQET3_11715 [Promethearchaeati archaeon]